MNDIDQLREISLEGRQEIARKVGRILANTANGLEKQAALELAKALVEDAAVSVREALSAELRTCLFLPKDIVQSIAHDIEQVSMPFLVAASAIDDALLEEIVLSGNEKAQEAIAGRKGLSEAVSFAISDVGTKPAVDTLLSNETADVSKRSCDRVVDRFPDERSLMEKLAARADLPIDVVERIIFKISREYGEYMAKKYRLSNDYASYLVSLANRQVFARTIELAPQAEMENYLRQLHSVKSLGSDMLLNYLQNGHIRLFTTALSILSGKSYRVIEDILNKRDKNLLARQLELAGFSRSVVGVLLIAFERLR
ncbi:DUF2336 domain-containing protein [Kordiimonas pumila]|uniref:DUF2336 domain-containing protein n=1 Tax=Kordiimonas pumila TaxID=2161677 RepID=A0ABV7D286_9PROT|nr:DUF2336 domain-containing protein [Kordiimonas pumila]